MSYYRDIYLKSNDWKTLRKSKLWQKKDKCQLCGIVSPGNDVHHIKYKRLFNVELNDLLVVCRKCHDWIHDLLEKYPGLKQMARDQMWRTILAHKSRPLRLGNVSRRRRAKMFFKYQQHKKTLFAAGLMIKRRMPWRDEFPDDPDFRIALV